MKFFYVLGQPIIIFNGSGDYADNVATLFEYEKKKKNMIKEMQRRIQGKSKSDPKEEPIGR
mgnify:CR=1 FL=1